MSFRLEDNIRENVKNLKPYSSARDEYVSSGTDMIFLDANENPYENGVNRYPDPQQRGLKSLLAQQKGISKNQLLLGNGSDEVLDLLFRAFCEPKEDNVITMPPTYGMYTVLSDLNIVENKRVLLTSNFEPDVDTILQTVTKNSKIIFVCSPNNPTGNAFSQERIAQLLENFDGLVVIDEAYIDFSESPSWVSQLDKYPNLVVTQTLSKAYGMAGIRLGICIASEEIIKVLNKIKPPYNVNELTQQRAVDRLKDLGSVKDEIAGILRERKLLKEALEDIDFVQKVFPTDANFILAQVDDAGLRYNQLLQHGIVVRNRSKQPLCKNTLRFTVGTKEENKNVVRVLKTLTNQY